MGWTRAFKDAAGVARLEPRFAVATIDGPDTSFILTATFSELPDTGAATADLVMDDAGPQVSGEGLQMPSATTNHGGFSWRAVGVNPNRVIQATRRGRILQLLMSLDGTGYEPVAIGMVDTRRVTRADAGAAMTVACTGFGALLAQRYTSPTGRRGLFEDGTFETRLTAAYSTSDTTITVADTSAWAGFDTASVYYLRIIPRDGSAAFYLRATGRTATTFTGATGSAVWATTEVDSSVGSVVGVARGTQLGGNYTAGDATVTVDETSPWDILDNDSVYYLRIFPSSGDPFVLRATGTTATTFTSVASSGRLGTTAVNATTNDEVQLVRVVQGHPVECALKVLTSTGAGTNGAFDTLPSDWGLALSQSVVDLTDSRYQRDLALPASGSTLWEIEVAEGTIINDAGAWISSWLAPFGALITGRQGRIYVRVLTQPGKASADGTIVAEFSDADIIAAEVELEDSTQAIEYGTVTYLAQTSAQSSTEDITTAPSVDRTEVDLSAYLFENLSAVLTEITQRIGQFWLRIPSRLTLELATLRAAQLCPGDLIRVSCTWLDLIPNAAKSTSCQSRVCVVQQVDVDYPGATVTVQALHYPEAADI